MPSGGKKKASRKHGRHKIECHAYRISGRREINKLKKLKRHLKQARHANDQCAVAARKGLRSYEIMR